MEMMMRMGIWEGEEMEQKEPRWVMTSSIDK